MHETDGVRFIKGANDEDDEFEVLVEEKHLHYAGAKSKKKRTKTSLLLP